MIVEIMVKIRLSKVLKVVRLFSLVLFLKATTEGEYVSVVIVC
jgi:hypothetical protein